LPKYYFHVRRVLAATTNETISAECEDDDAARTMAGSIIAAAADELAQLVGMLEIEVTVRTLDGHELARRWARFVADNYR